MKKFIFSAALAVIAILAIFSFSTEDQGASTEVASQQPAKETVSASRAIVAIQGVTDNTAIASAAGARSKTISWEAQNLPSNIGVDINLLQKTSDSPASYKLVRKIASNTVNDGSEVWTPLANETGNDLYIEVTCASGMTVTDGCQVASEPAKAN